MMRFAWCVCVVSAAAVAFGETVVTSPDVFEVAISGDVTIAPVTVEVTAEPADLPTPVFHFDATRSFGRNLTLNLVGFDPERDLGKKFVIARAAEYAGLDDLKAATVTGLEIPAGCTLKFRATSGGDLVMKLAPDGTLLLVR